jgi:hypothetical protein
VNSYAIQCGIAYEGNEIDTSDINEMSASRAASNFSASAATIGGFSRTRAAAAISSAAVVEISFGTRLVASTSSATGIDESDEFWTDEMSGPGPSTPIEGEDTDDENDMSEMAGMSMLAKRATVPDVQSCPMFNRAETFATQRQVARLSTSWAPTARFSAQSPDTHMLPAQLQE